MAQTERHFQRLTEAVTWSYERQEVDRLGHKSIVRHLIGEYYPALDGEGGPQTPIPLLSMASRAMARGLISKSPRMLANAADPALKSWAESAEIAGNERLQRMNASSILREVVGQSMASFGISFLAPVYVGTPTGMKLDLGIEAIDRADYVYDHDSSTLEDPDYEGHKFRMKLVDIHEHPLFDERKTDVTDDGHDQSAQDTTNVRRQPGGRQSLYDYAEIWCVYDRPRNKLIYYPRAQPSIKLLEVDWLGPPHGPYRKLYYEKPPGNAVPISPLMHLMTTHRAYCVLGMKSIHQQQVAKGLLKYTNASKEEAKSIIRAVENEAVLQENGAVEYTHIGGASQSTVAMTEKMKADFSYASSGVVDQFMKKADTLGQERLLRGSTNDMLDDMAGWAYQYIKGLVQDVYWFDVRDPDQSPRTLRKPIEGTDETYESPWTPEHRQMVTELELEIDVEPYSYVERSPDTRLADVLGALQIIMGMGDQAAAQGISIDVEGVVRTIARYKNLPELYDVLVLNQDPERLQQLLGSGPRGGGAQEGGPKKYIRESRSDGSGKDQEVMRMFADKQEAVA